MTNPITPPPELLDLVSSGAEAEIAEKILQWAAPILRQQGADQELEACCEWLDERAVLNGATALRTARRPKPPSLKKQGLQALGRFNANAHTTAGEMTADFDTIRRALEALDD